MEETLVLIVVPHRALRESLVMLLSAEAWLSLVVLPVAAAAGIVAATVEHEPHVLLLVFAGGLHGGGALVRRVRVAAPRTAVVLAGGLDHDTAANAAADAGAFAYVPLEGLGPELVGTLRSAASAAGSR